MHASNRLAAIQFAVHSVVVFGDSHRLSQCEKGLHYFLSAIVTQHNCVAFGEFGVEVIEKPKR
jgi:hypothetical protein